VTVVVVGLVAAPATAFAASRTPASGTSTTGLSASYTPIGRAPRLPAGARTVHAAVPSGSVSGAVALKPRDPAALERAAAAVSNPRSPSYHHYVAKGAFRARFGPTSATISAVESVLRAGNLRVTSVSANGLLVQFSGTVGAAQTAFRTTLADVRLASGRTGTETTAPVSFPANVAPQVSAVIGLDTLVRSTTNLEHATHPAAVKAVTHVIHPAAGAASACPAATSVAALDGGLTDDQIAHAYDVDGLYEAGDLGAGQTIAIYELEPFATSDISAFDTCYFGSSEASQMASRLHTINIDGGGGAGAGSGESVLDIEDVSALAPDATIDVYEAPNSTAGSIDEYNAMVAADSAKIVTSSWGFCEQDEINLQPGYINVENDVFEQAALQGQTVLNSSGDSGSDECAYDNPGPVAPVLSQSDPASQPFVLGVGGTTITSATDPPAETVWNDGAIGGGSGGGPSSVWGAPSWQQPFITGADKTAAQNAVSDYGLTPCKQSADASMCREAPDVSAQADEFTGAITIYAAVFGGWTTEGGTSSSAPLWAAMLAEINASAGCTSPIGFVNPSLYAIAANSADYAQAFNDVTVGNNDDFDIADGQTFEAGPGYDMATGLGTPRVSSLANFLCNLTPPPMRPTITSLSASTEPAVPSGSLTITGTGFAGAAAVSIDAYALPAASWSVTNDTTIVITSIPTAAQVGTASIGPQDGTGRAVLSVTGSDGATSLLSAASTLLYVAGTAVAPVPSVEGVAAYGGPQAGGNTVKVFGSAFTSTGPDAITSVTVGGVTAASVTVLNASTLSVVIPPYIAGTTACAAGDNPVHDVCQAQVVVSNANGASATSTIRPPYTGQEYEGVSTGMSFPACVTAATCEIVAAVSEYDYLPTPTITSVTTTSKRNPVTWASEAGNTVATVKGFGFDYLGLEYTNVGTPSIADNQDFDLLGIASTEFQVVLNGRQLTRESLTRPFTVQTLGGRSVSWPITFAGVPEVLAVRPSAGPDTGGTHIAVSGRGFDGAPAADGGAVTLDSLNTAATAGAVTHYSLSNNELLKATTPASDPAAFTVQVCTITLCSEPTTKESAARSLFDAYQPKAPIVTSISVRAGPAAGGTRVVIHGHRLADAVKVSFGKAVAEATTRPEILANGTARALAAIAPPGKAGTTVEVRVTTVESLVTRHGPSAPSLRARFTYRRSVASRPRQVRVTTHPHALAVTWKPPASDGGFPILRYRLKAIALPGGNSPTLPPTVIVVTKHGSASFARLRGLRAGWSYSVTIQAVTRKGRGLVAEPMRNYPIKGSV
jgi:hypothetical protein